MMKARNIALERELNEVKGTNEYTNMIIATGNAKGIKFTEKWIINHLLGLVEDGMMTYGEALNANVVYVKLLNMINR